MKLAYFNDYRLGIVRGDEVVDVTSVASDVPHRNPADMMIKSLPARKLTACAFRVGLLIGGVLEQRQNCSDSGSLSTITRDSSESRHP